MKEQFKTLIGKIPTDKSNFTHRIRIHQGWWRAFVLAEVEGVHPNDDSKTVCNTIRNGQVSGSNFLSDSVVQVVGQILNKRDSSSKGMINQDRLYNNLLSSQPLCFNFFAGFVNDKDLALQVLRQFWPHIDQVTNILFEYAPDENYSNDNSAFDVAFQVKSGDKTGLIGLECKYTDTFSAKEYINSAYQTIYNASDAFKSGFDEFITSRYNQLFRNQLIAESVLQNGKYDFSHAGLFCHHGDESAIKIAGEFQKMMYDGEERFKLITYRDFITTMQKLDLTWQQREYSMLLWARYFGLELSERINRIL